MQRGHYDVEQRHKTAIKQLQYRYKKNFGRCNNLTMRLWANSGSSPVRTAKQLIVKEGVSKSTPSLFSTKPRLSQAGALLLPKDSVSLSLKIYTYGKDTFSSLHSQPNGTISAKNR